MPYLILKGTFHIVGKKPDGDTISFRASNLENWLKLAGKRVPRISGAGDVNIRFEAIDALETHYRGKSWLPEYRQPDTFANKARDTMLSEVGIDPEQVIWSGDKVGSAPDGTPGYIATNGIDPFNRVIAFVFAGEPPTQDGDDEFILMSKHVEKSVNFALAQKGLVYPTFYAALYPSLRDTVAQACIQARNEGHGLWPHDVGISGVTIPSNEDLRPITHEHCIMPKLFRRLITHLSQNGQVRNFKGFLYEQEDVTIHIPKCEMATFGRFVNVDKNASRVRLNVLPEQLLFAPG